MAALLEQLEEHGATVDAMVAALVLTCVGPLLDFLDGALRVLYRVWAKVDPTPGEAPRVVARALDGAPTPTAPSKADLLELAAVGAGLVVATSKATARAGRRPVTLSPVTRAAVLGAVPGWNEWQAGKPRAVLLGQVETLADAEQVLAAERGRAQRVVAAVDTAGRSAVVDGQHTAAAGFGLSATWVAERDGCVVCLALAGKVITVGAEFPHDATYGDKPQPVFGGVLAGPPRHPHCRCQLAYGTAAQLSPFAAGLRREAARSVARGFSLPSESEASRLRAADRLLARGSGLPKSVQAYARKAVKAGAFPNGRDVPDPVLLNPINPTP
jgi:hypothetical protein